MKYSLPNNLWDTLKDNFRISIYVYSTEVKGKKDEKRSTSGIEFSKQSNVQEFHFLYIPEEIQDSYGQDIVDVSQSFDVLQNTQKLGWLFGIPQFQNLYRRVMFPKFNQGPTPRENINQDFILFHQGNQEENILKPISYLVSYLSPDVGDGGSNVLMLGKIQIIGPSKYVFQVNIQNLVLQPYQGLQKISWSFKGGFQPQDQIRKNFYRPMLQQVSLSFTDMLPLLWDKRNEIIGQEATVYDLKFYYENQDDYTTNLSNIQNKIIK